MHATTCARSSALIFSRWYARSSWRSSRFKTRPTLAETTPSRTVLRSRPAAAGGWGAASRLPPSAPGTYAAVSKEPVPARGRTRRVRLPRGFLFPGSAKTRGGVGEPAARLRFSRLRPEDLDECDFECAFAFPSPLGRFHSPLHRGFEFVPVRRGDVGVVLLSRRGRLRHAVLLEELSLFVVAPGAIVGKTAPPSTCPSWRSARTRHARPGCGARPSSSGRGRCRA